MAKKLYVGNLPYSITADTLKEKFAAVGEVTSSTIISDKFSGRSKGFGFVEMANDDEAANAIQQFNETDWEGRKMIVNEARPLEDRPPRRDFRGPRA